MKRLHVCAYCIGPDGQRGSDPPITCGHWLEDTPVPIWKTILAYIRRLR